MKKKNTILAILLLMTLTGCGAEAGVYTEKTARAIQEGFTSLSVATLIGFLINGLLK